MSFYLLLLSSLSSFSLSFSSLSLSSLSLYLLSLLSSSLLLSSFFVVLEFGNDSDGSDDSAKNWRHKKAFKCKCSLHTRLANDNSPQPKKPRNSWRQQEYPDDCRLNWLRAGKIKIPEK